VIATILILGSVYILCGLIFAIPFALLGVKRIDPPAVHGSWGFRLLIFPGSVALWPLLLRRWANAVHGPPEEDNAHRHLASAAEKRK
jgi:hypothetical protein